MPIRENLYFIAIIAPDAVAAQVTAFRHDMSENYGSKAALRVMPHITLKAPFKLPAEERPGLLDWFANIPESAGPFPIFLENFGCFDNRHSKVIYVKPVLSPQLAGLQSSVVNSFSEAYPHINMTAHEKEFSPHMTIAYRDLTPENFERAWSVYKGKQYASSFMFKSFCLLQHNGMKWEVVTEHGL